MLETELITRVMLFDPVNQCQGFCWDTKRKQFILATISSDNKYVSIICEQHSVTKDGIKYLPLSIVEEIGFDYKQSAVMEVEFE